MKGKTNAQRMLDSAKIPYEVREYEVDEDNLAGTHIADQIGLPYEMVFKTLVARGDKTGVAVFVIPVAREIDLKKAARATGNKKIELVPVKELLSLTGYIRGGCSPVGMKKRYPTFFDTSALSQKTITVSAGVRGAQLLVETEALARFVGAAFEDITASAE